MEEKFINKEPSDEVTLKDIILKLGDWFSYLLSKWVIICVFGLIGGAIGFAYASSKKKMYLASTSFVLEEGDKGGGLSQYAGLASMAGIDIGGSGGTGIFQGDNILELYKSRAMIQKTLLTEVVNNGKKELLVDSYIDINELKKDWDKDPKMKGFHFQKLASDTSVLKPDRLRDSVLGVIVKDIAKNYLKVDKPDKKLGIIQADVKAPDEFFAKSFNNQIVKVVNDFYIQTKTKKSIQSVVILQQKTDSVRRVMNGSIYTAAAIADATPNLNPTRQVQRIAPVQRSQFSIEANKAILAELTKNLELSKISLRKETPLIQVVDEPVLPLEITVFGKLKGIVIGGLAAGFLTCAVLIIRRVFKMILV